MRDGSVEGEPPAGMGLRELLDELNRTGTVFPGTGLRMVYELPENGAEPGEDAS